MTFPRTLVTAAFSASLLLALSGCATGGDEADDAEMAAAPLDGKNLLGNAGFEKPLLTSKQAKGNPFAKNWNRDEPGDAITRAPVDDPTADNARSLVIRVDPDDMPAVGQRLHVKEG